MTPTDAVALLPFEVLSAGIVATMLLIAFHRSHALTFVATVAVLALSLLTLPFTSTVAPRQVTPLIVVDGYSLFFFGLLVAASTGVALLAYGYLRERPGIQEEWYLLLLLATLGAAVLAASTHFATFFLGLEILSVALYTLIAYPRTVERAIEAGLKYLILAAASAAFLLFGMALIYGALGTMQFARIASQSIGSDFTAGLLVLSGSALLITGAGFKLAVVPFHMWTPDVYEGAPAPVAAFVATVSKGGMFALLLRYFTEVDIRAYATLFLAFSAIAVASMFVGNLLALLQNNVKRILAYSSIAHFGYLLVAFLASGILAATAASFYLVAYFLMTLIAFGVVSVLSGLERDADAMGDYRGLFWRQPWLALVFATSLLSLAGMPLTAGFVGKFLLVAAGVQDKLWALVLVMVINSAISLFYYVRIIIAMYSSPLEDSGAGRAPSLSLVGAATLAVLTMLLVWFGVYPSPLIALIEGAVSSLM